MRLTNFFALAISALMSVGVMAQTDVTADYLTNYNFDSGFHYKKGATNEVKQEIKDIKGWTAGFTVDYTITGIYEYGFAGTFNGGSVPEKGYNGGTTGGALALSTGWGVSMTYYQTVTLPAGVYTIYAPTYNGKSATKGTSELSWVPVNGTAVKSTIKSYPSKAWTLDQITFTLTQETKGKIQIGYQAGDGGSSNSANLLIDYVQILVQDMTAIKEKLSQTLQSATTAYADGSGREASSLLAAIEQAQAVLDNAESTVGDLLTADEALQAALDNYRWLNASETNPVDCTDLFLTNPSFEDGTSGWTVKGMSTQSNNVFSQKEGTYYLEAWTSIGNKIGNTSVLQTITGLPKGKYKLTATALHIQQTGSGSSTNNGSAQKGATLVAGLHQTTITAMRTYSIEFTVVDENEKTNIGAMTVNPTGNYFCVDNFRLLYIGEVATNDYAKALEELITVGEKALAKPIQDVATEALSAAIEQARTALQGTGTDDEGNKIYDENAIEQAHNALSDAIQLANDSHQLYNDLAQRIDYAKKVVNWWKDSERKSTTVNNLMSAIETANERMEDYTLTDDQLRGAVNALNRRITAVDKKIYCSGSACGSDAKLQDNDNQWSYKRSMQSKHWVVFWEKGYGDEAPEPVANILSTADKIFEMYANKLGFITINQGKSKTDTYKMIIRLKSTSDWIAEGSGIDNQIGMLTLSRWAYTSRGGQTVAHEIGHCFQYQVHCDNGDWNGWMYNWHQSTQNPFWEMCAQWMAYVYYPNQLLDGNEWLWNSLNGMHRHPMAGYLRYENFFIQNWFVHKFGWDAVGRLWNDCKDPEDPFETYMRTRMTGSISQKVSLLGDEMWEWGARMTTFDLDPIRSIANGKASWRSQTALTKDAEGYWWPEKKACIENYGNNAIRINAPSKATTLYVDFEGKAGEEGYTAYNTNRAGWRIGFVAFKGDGTRIYSDITRATYNDANHSISFDCPAGCTHVWLVVSGAPTSYWSRDLTNWVESTAEQWPYRVKFYMTNVYGEPNNGVPSGIEEIAGGNQQANDENVYSISGQLVRQGTTSLDGLPHGIYIVAGKKVLK